MKKGMALLFLTMIISLLPLSARAEESASMMFPAGSGGLSVGIDLMDRAGNLGVGAELTSPYFLWKRVAVRVRGEFLWDEVDWNPFYLVKGGLVGVGGYVGDGIRLYGEGGVLLLFPTSALSTEELAFGGYGHFGFEFLIGPFERSHVSYLVELGTTGVGFRADQLAGAPLLVNGFAVTTGLRLYFF